MTKNKNYFIPGLLVVAIGWAVVATFLLYRSTLPLRVGGESSLSAATEELAFLKQFIDQYFTYDSDNFRQTQMALTGVMEDKLKDRRLSEITLLHERSGQKRFLQNVEILTLRATEQNSYEAEVKISAFQDRKKSEIFVTVTVILSSHSPTTENPWGYRVREIAVKSLAKPDDGPQEKRPLRVVVGKPLTLKFPCAIESVENLSEPRWKYRITTTQTSEVQLTLLEALANDETLKLSCDTRSFLISAISSGGFPHDLFRFVLASASIPRIGTKRAADPVPSADRKTFENELNFIISE